MFLNAILLALREIRRNVLRSSLTILGIVIGVAAVITMVTIGEGATAQVQADIQKLGTNLLQVFRGQGFGGRAARAPRRRRSAWRTCVRSRTRSPACAPWRRARTRWPQAIYGNTNWSTQVTGTTDKFLRGARLGARRRAQLLRVRTARRRCRLPARQHRASRSCSASRIRSASSIRLQKLSCQVIGVLTPKGQSGFGQDQDDLVVIPLRTLQRRMAGNADVGAILVSARDGVSTEKVQADLERLLRERRKIRAGADDDFNVRDLKEVASAFTSSTRVLTALLGAVAAVSLIVGGVGIMNIMLVSVTERTREIGTRLAVGAMARDVLLQFLIEAVVLAALGGVIGILLGLGAGALATNAFNVPFVLNPGIVFLSFAFSRRCRHRLRLFPGAARCTTRSDRGAAARVDVVCRS